MLLSHWELHPRNSQWIWVQVTKVTFKNLFQQRWGGGRGSLQDNKEAVTANRALGRN